MPPTPTLIPMGAPPPILIPQVSLWEYTDYTLSIWGMLGASRTTVAQWVLIVVIVLFAIFLLIPLIRSLVNRGETE
jgi:hypothetical protein